MALELARRAGGEIVSLDSMKVYRRMNVGTAKPGDSARAAVPHHLIDVAEPHEEFTVARYVTLADQVIRDIQRRGRPVFFSGGTPLYLKAMTEGLFDGPGADAAIRDRLCEQAEQMGSAALHRELERIDPVTAARVHANDLRRIIRAMEVFELTGTPISALQEQWDRDRTRYECVLIGVRREKEDQSHRINDRVRRMFDAGLVDEVRSLLAEPLPLSETARKALGYAEVIDHLFGGTSLAEAVELIKINTRRFAKAQRTWFKRFRATRWIDVAADAVVDEVADRAMKELDP